MTRRLKQAKSIILSDFTGLKVKEMQALRQELSKNEVNYLVTKKTMLAKALKDAKINLDVRAIKGSMAIGFGLSDEIAPAKILYNFSRKHEALKLLGGALLEGEIAILDQAKVLALAKLPSREQLLGKLLATLNGPLQKLAYTLSANLVSLVYILKQKSEKI